MRKPAFCGFCPLFIPGFVEGSLVSTALNTYKDPRPLISVTETILSFSRDLYNNVVDIKTPNSVFKMAHTSLMGIAFYEVSRC